ncbi:hypothetical protein [Cetobacterium sp.]|uniref:hypothetical protein n=1 Tax=Cetobacterium sp. TaxID=2071632 RepID=UPI003EE5A46B
MQQKQRWENTIDKIRKTFYKRWSKEKSDIFYKTLESSVLSYKLECLEKFIENIFEENLAVKRDEILRCAKNMDAFTDAEEFLVDLKLQVHLRVMLLLQD